jgi:hydrogenase maturation protease
MTGRMLIAGVGNIFLGDDGFGAEVARRLAAVDLPDWVRVADYGISGMHLAYDLAEGYETTILVDASPRGGEPGTVYVMEVEAGSPSAAAPHLGVPDPSRGGPSGESPLLDAHGMQPDVVFSMLDMLGGDAGRVLVVGCEPASIDEGIGLSAPVTAAVDQAVRVVLDLVRAAGPHAGPDAAALSPHRALAPHSHRSPACESTDGGALAPPSVHRRPDPARSEVASRGGEPTTAADNRRRG